MEVARERGRKLDPTHARRRDSTQQLGEWSSPLKPLQAIIRLGPVTVHILADQLYLLKARLAEPQNLTYNLARRAALLTPARIGHYAVRAEFVAALYDGYESHIRRVALDQ